MTRCASGMLDVECACGRRAEGSHAMLTSVGWRWSAAFRQYLCRECFRGILGISRDRERKEGA